MRISGFFRDAFPHVVTLLDDAVTLVAGLDEDPAEQPVRAHVQADLAEHGDQRRATAGCSAPVRAPTAPACCR